MAKLWVWVSAQFWFGGFLWVEGFSSSCLRDFLCVGLSGLLFLLGVLGPAWVVWVAGSSVPPAASRFGFWVFFVSKIFLA